ncbi:hypothetical protein LOTGIDRAFT_227422 [Lottia gigantea]|uniref:Large ribosomal subunit protein P1 n=1 Tax=Lottia gigantea TaxID=225164 RepID=V4BY94_LOTGI|nr:hypothetical protein LOTGIDRAFT_227422 [Lottia gigantea]ESO94094.1 hypothetical protein LOTGIDRAFT_227422 [Lottia gigantea]
MTSTDELACVYAALLLADDNVSITAEKISTVLKAAGVLVEPYWPSLFSKALDGVNVKELITNIGSAAGSAPAAAPAGGAPAAGGEAKAETKKEEKKEESEESDDDMGFGMFNYSHLLGSPHYFIL